MQGLATITLHEGGVNKRIRTYGSDTSLAAYVIWQTESVMQDVDKSGRG